MGSDPEHEYHIGELLRLLHSMADIAVITDVDHAAQKIRVSPKGVNASESDKSNWLDWAADQGRNYARWRPLREGQQVMILAPNGDLSQAKIVGMLPSAAIPNPSTDPDVDLVEFTNGARISHNVKTGDMQMHIKGNWDVVVDGHHTVTAQQHFIKGGVTQTGGDMTSDGVSAQRHIHDGVIPGGGKSKEPVK